MKRRLVIGDIHGCFQTLKNLFEKEIVITKEDDIYLLGDYIDRGPGSRQVIEYLIQLKWQGFRIFPLMGNHEDMLVQAILDENALQAWHNNGAEETLKSFGVSESMLFDYEALSLIPERYIHFMANLPLFYDLDHFILVHAGLNFRRPDVFGDREAMLWIRDLCYQGDKIGQKTLIHGHTPMPFISIQNTLRKKNEKLINLDAGCVYKDLPGYGKLLGMDLDSRELYVVENSD